MLPLAFLCAFIGHDEPLHFEISCPISAYSGSEAVTAVVYLSKSMGQPMYGPNWFHPEPCYSAPFHSTAGQKLTVSDGNATGFPARLSHLEPGTYTVQAVLDRNLGGRSIASSPGNYYSDPQTLTIDPNSSGAIPIECPHLVAEPQLQDTDQIKFIRFESPMLTSFYRRPTFIKAAIGLPSIYSLPKAGRFPVVYEIPGFGGSSDNVRAATRMVQNTVRDGQSFINVLLDPNVPTGHCVFADSANNGPWGTALVKEFIPYLESRFRMVARPSGRFLTGHSSGGWSSLWLQVSHPEFFGGVWSTSPDPVDFTDFQMIDIYRPGENMFFDAEGNPRPLARDDGKILAYYKPFSDMERPIRGEQLGSFEAVFSPRGPDGSPQKLWDRESGKIDPVVADYWKKYDIDLILSNQWEKLGPKLRGKLHVFCGTEDTFYLDGAVKKLKANLATLHSDAEVELLPGNHSTVMTRTLIDHINSEMARKFDMADKS